MKTSIDDSSAGGTGAGSADTSRSKEAASGGLNLPSLKAVVAELVTNGKVAHRFGATGEVEVKATLTSDRRDWRLRVSVFQEGKEVQEDADGAYPVDGKISRAPGAERTNGEIDRIAKKLAEKHLAACSSAQKLLPPKRPINWLLVAALLALLAGGSWAAWLLSSHEGPPAPTTPRAIRPPPEPLVSPSPAPPGVPTEEILGCIEAKSNCK